MNTSPDLDLTVLEDMEFSIACEYTLHGLPDEPAEWIAWAKPVCDCRKTHFRYFCDPCLRYRLSFFQGEVRCTICEARGPISEHEIYRVEPIRKVD